MSFIYQRNVTFPYRMSSNLLFATLTLIQESGLPIDCVDVEDEISLKSHPTLGQHFLKHFPMHVGEPEVAALEPIGQFQMIDSQQMQ